MTFEEEYGYQWERDPRCPGCKAVHLTKEDFLKGLPRKED
jgi:hypothetical protein